MDTAINTDLPFNAELLETPIDLSRATEAARSTLNETGNHWLAYEAFKRALPEMSAEEYEPAIKGICQELGL